MENSCETGDQSKSKSALLCNDQGDNMGSELSIPEGQGVPSAELKSWRPSRTFILLISTVGLLVIISIVYALVSRGNDKQAAITPATDQAVAPVVPAVPAPPQILTKDAEFVQLLHPADGEALLSLSPEFAQKKQEIEAELAAIQDPELRSRTSDQEWAKVDKDTYIERERKARADAFPTAMRDVLSKHRAGWFEVGHVSFPGTSELEINSVDASPLGLPNGATVETTVATMDSVYSKFSNITQGQIDQTLAYQLAQVPSCDQQLRNVCENLGGSSSQCSDPSELENIRSQISFSCQTGPSADELRRKAESETRTSRLILVGQGDVIDRRIDKLMLVDYDTEAILLELPASSLKGQVHWKSLIQSQWISSQ